LARPLRIEFAGALYHVTSRGNKCEDIYLSDRDRELFLSILGEVCQRFNWHCHAYCLMSNHYHLLIETPDANLAQGMRQLNGVYTQRFNQAQKRVGHVFQGRYKAILVEKDSYLLELSRYIVLNPVRARMVRAAQDWPWSSYRATVGFSQAPQWLTVNWVLSAFGPYLSEAVNGYELFIAEGAGQPSPWEQLKNQIYLGSDQFVSAMQAKIETDQELSEIPLSQRRPMPKPLGWYEKSGATRDDAVKLAYASGGYSMKKIGDYFGLHYSRVSRIIVKAKGKT
jgi:REP element-mobilizing transposase RayT